jgi:PAS domain S-box-containing protein
MSKEDGTTAPIGEQEAGEQTEELLIPRDDQHRILWDNAYDAIAITDGEGRLLQANRRYAQMLGYTEKEIRTLYLEDIIHPEDLELVRERHLRRLRGAETPCTYAARCVRKDGAVLHLQTTSSVLSMAGVGDVTLDIIRDITLQVTAEAEIRERNALLMRSNQRYQDLLDFMTHELKNPLTMLRAYSELLVEGSGGKLTRKGHRIAVNLWRGANRMEHLISTYLHLSRIESGNVAVHRERAAFVRDIVNPATDFLAIQLEANEMTVEIHPDGLQEIEVWVDKELMQAAVQNVLSNAIKYGYKSSPITIRIEADDDSMSVAFRNMGAGIPGERLEDVFKKYHRGHRRGDNPLRSSGIGLYLVRRIMEEHGGQASMDSTEGEWAQARLCLPMRITLPPP